MLVCEQFKYLLLAEGLPLGGEVDAVRLVFGIERLDGGADGLGGHHHARAAAEGIIVALAVLVFGIAADVDDVYLQLVLFLRPAEDAGGEGREHFGEKGEDIDLHCSTITSESRLPSTVITCALTSTPSTTPSAAGNIYCFAPDSST